MAAGVNPVLVEDALVDNNNGSGKRRDKSPLRSGSRAVASTLSRCYYAMASVFNRDATRRQVRAFADLVRPLGVTVRVREVPGRWIVFAQLQRDVRNKVLLAQDEVANTLGAVAFELILVYPEDAQRSGMQEVLRSATSP